MQTEGKNGGGLGTRLTFIQEPLKKHDAAGGGCGLEKGQVYLIS